MSVPVTDELLEELRKFDTPSVTNVVATYPSNPICLGLYHPWTQYWYTDHSLRCWYPELGPVVGYAVTCVYGLPDPTYGHLGFPDVVEAVERAPKPVVLIIEQRFPSEIAGKVGLSGGNMTSALKAVGCTGVLTNGPSRDIDEIRGMGIQYLTSGVTPGHGPTAVHAVNVPVHIAGMDVAPGEIVHMDENGAVKFPADRIGEVLTRVQQLKREEETQQAALQHAKSAAEIRAILMGHSYGKAKRGE